MAETAAVPKHRSGLANRCASRARLSFVGAALATMFGGIVVGVLVFLNSRLDAGDRRKGLLAEAEILSKLAPDSKQHEDMRTVVDESIADYRGWQRSRRGSERLTRVLWILGVSVPVMVIALNASRWFDLGKAAPLADLIGWTAAGVVIGQFVSNPQTLFRR